MFYQKEKGRFISPIKLKQEMAIFITRDLVEPKTT